MNPLTTARTVLAGHKALTVIGGLLVLALTAVALLGVGLTDRETRIAALESDRATLESALTTTASDRDAALTDVARQRERAEKAEAATHAADERKAELDAREQALADREAAVTATENHVAETSITDGTWTVGRDVQPGTYRTAEAVSAHCYWGIYRSDTNGSDIVENDIVTGGFPTVTLREGQDFTSTRCGTWHQQ